MLAWAVLAPFPGWAGAGVGGGCLAAVAAMALVTWRLPADLPLVRVDPARARAAVEPSEARLRAALRPEMPGWYRVDVFLDGRRLGQLRPGTAFALPVAPGEHVVTLRVWLRRLRARELVNALPGTDTDVVIGASGGRSRSYAVGRHGMDALLADRRMVVVAAG